MFEDLFRGLRAPLGDGHIWGVPRIVQQVVLSLGMSQSQIWQI